MKPHKRNFVLVALALVLAAVLLGWQMLPFNAYLSRDVGSQFEARSPQPEAPLKPLQQQRSEIEPVEHARSPVTDEEDLGANPTTHVQDDGEPDALAESEHRSPLSIRLHFIDGESFEPLTGFAFNYGTFQTLSEYRTAESDDFRAHSGVTNSNGDFLCPRGFFRLVIGPSDPQWLMFASGERRTSDGALMLDALAFRRDDVGRVITISCIRGVPLTIVATYSNGKPFDGSARYGVWPVEGHEDSVAQPTPVCSGTLIFDADGNAEIPRVPKTGSLVMSLKSSRAGWKGRTGAGGELTGERTLYVTIQEEVRTQHGLTLVFPEHQDAYPVDVVVRDGWGATLFRFTQTAAGVWKSQALFKPLLLSVTVRGEYSWKPAPIQLVADKWVEVPVELRKSCTLRFKVVDEHGQPVFPAVAVADPTISLDWSRPEKYEKAKSNYDFATADEDGNISLESLPSGSGEFVVEALGYEAHLESYEAEAGETVLLPDIVLREYVGVEGTVSVRLIGTTDVKKYKCAVRTYDGRGGVRSRFPEDDGTLTFEGLPFRKYVVIAVRKEGGAVWQQHIELSPGRPSADVTLNVSQPDSKGVPGN